MGYANKIIQRSHIKNALTVGKRKQWKRVYKGFPYLVMVSDYRRVSSEINLHFLLFCIANCLAIVKQQQQQQQKSRENNNKLQHFLIQSEVKPKLIPELSNTFLVHVASLAISFRVLIGSLDCLCILLLELFLLHWIENRCMEITVKLQSTVVQSMFFPIFRWQDKVWLY